MLVGRVFELVMLGDGLFVGSGVIDGVTPDSGVGEISKSLFSI